jgi:hypothetical protein
MDTTFQSGLIASPTTRARWAGRIVTTIPALLLSLDGAMKLVQPQPVIDAFARLGVPHHTAPVIAVLELVCIALYLVPRTAVLGAVLLTGFLGGAVAIHLRIDDPLATHTLFPIYMGILVWLGLYLRDARVRALASTLLGAQR